MNKQDKSILFTLVILIGICGAFTEGSSTFAPNDSDPWVKYYSDSEYSSETSEFTMDDFIRLEAHLPAYNTTANDELNFWVSSTFHPTLIKAILNETSNSSAIFRGFVAPSFDHANDGNSARYARIQCDRLGDNVSIWLDLSNNGTKEVVAVLPILLDVETNMVHDVTRVTAFSFLIPVILGILFAFVPEEKILLFFQKRADKSKLRFEPRKIQLANWISKPDKKILNWIAKLVLKLKTISEIIYNYFKGYAEKRQAAEALGESNSDFNFGNAIAYFVKGMIVGIPMALFMWGLSILGIWITPLGTVVGALPIEYRSPFGLALKFLIYRIVYGSLVSSILVMVGMVFPEMYKMLMNAQSGKEIKDSRPKHPDQGDLSDAPYQYHPKQSKPE